MLEEGTTLSDIDEELIQNKLQTLSVRKALFQLYR